MVWKKLPKQEISKEEYQQGALYGLYLIVGLGVLAWLIENFKYIG